VIPKAAFRRWERIVGEYISRLVANCFTHLHYILDCNSVGMACAQTEDVGKLEAK
jgi:hypothetical protein